MRNGEIDRAAIMESAESSPIDEPFIEYIPRVNCIVQNNGLIPPPFPIIERMAALGIPNSHRESQLGHSETLTEMTGELIEGLDNAGIIQVQTDTLARLKTGAFLHDIGKTGPESAINPNPAIFVKLFNTDFSGDLRHVKFRTALFQATQEGKITQEEKIYIERVLREYGIDPDKMTLRTFFNLHSLFTYGVLLEGGMSEEMARIAASHHLKREIRPNGYSWSELAETGRFIEPMDELAAMVRRNNPKTLQMSCIERIRAVYEGFSPLRKSVGTPYQETIQTALNHGILQRIVEKHPHQKN